MKDKEDELRKSVQALIFKYWGNDLAIGKQVRRPDGRLVQIVDGQFLDPLYGRLSNFWYWRAVLKSGKLSRRLEWGYGWSTK